MCVTAFPRAAYPDLITDKDRANGLVLDNPSMIAHRLWDHSYNNITGAAIALTTSLAFYGYSYRYRRLYQCNALYHTLSLHMAQHTYMCYHHHQYCC